MKLTMYKNLVNEISTSTKYLIEVLIRAIILLTPVGVYCYILQMQSKPIPISSISTYTSDNSTFIITGPGVIVVNTDGKAWGRYVRLFKDTVKKALPKIYHTMIFIACMTITVFCVFHIITYFK
jgi:hypothetical protein